MSWQAYVDDSLVKSGHIDKGAIFNIDGTSCWAATPGYTISPEEMKAIAESFTSKGVDPSNDVKRVQSNGFDVAGLHYICHHATDNELYGKKGKEGTIVVKTNQALLIGHYPQTTTAGQAAMTVGGLADYLKPLGY